MKLYFVENAFESIPGAVVTVYLSAITIICTHNMFSKL